MATPTSDAILLAEHTIPCSAVTGCCAAARLIVRSAATGNRIIARSITQHLTHQMSKEKRSLRLFRHRLLVRIFRQLYLPGAAGVTAVAVALGPPAAPPPADGAAGAFAVPGVTLRLAS